MNKKVKDIIKNIRIIFFDFDGIFTDGKVYVNEKGEEFVVCSRKDTLRFSEMKKEGIELLVISKEKNFLVSKRCEKMDIKCYQGVDNKLEFLKKIINNKKIEKNNIAFMGDDLNDLECLKYVGFPITVANGNKKCKQNALYITKQNGGDHAVREVCDLFLDR